MQKTTIQINKSTLEKLKQLKKYERESYDEVITTLAEEAEEETLTKEEIEDLQEALEQVKRGELFSIEEVAKELNISLN
ncbi:hypothetical protein CMI48_03835 [Candidatus Pacearchaeota archaeon]|jgi:predicted CopG family antitoxin|nr:hypothetical protein [Candidatus Pacearchaeota archaeon]|tara:strand:- start:775 stop:1011 length:237 start_codon:yes stop_codon:yes gene_type:complete